MKNNIVAIIPFYNAEKFIDKCLLSVMTQKYNHFHIVVINDASTDKSHKRVLDWKKSWPDKITYIKNETRMGAMYNHQYAVFNYTKPNDIVVHVDGDDWLIDNWVFDNINDFYNKHDCWVMYSLHKNTQGHYGHCQAYETEQDFNNLRKGQFISGHLRSFKAFLFYEIRKQDPQLNCFKNSNGEWYEMTCDVAMMYPIMEIAGYNRVKFNSEILYIYNDKNPISDKIKDCQLQIDIHNEINKKPKFKQLP